MLSPGPNSPSDLDSSPSVVYDLDTGAVVAPTSDLPGFTPPEPKDPLMRDLERMLAPVRAIGSGIRLIGRRIRVSIAEFRSTYTDVRSDKGILSVFFRSIWDDATQRLRKLALIAAVPVCLALLIVLVVKTHKHHAHPRVAPDASERGDQSDRTVTTAAARADLTKEFGDPAATGSATSGTPQSDPMDASTDPTWQALRTKAAELIAHLQLNSARTPDSGFESPSVPPANPGQPARPTASGTSFSQSPAAKPLLPPGRMGAFTPASPTGAGVKQPVPDDSSAPDDASDVATNGDENGVMVQLYDEYAAHPHSVLGKDAGIYLAELYWYRAGADLRHGRKAKALTDWKRVVTFDPSAPIAIVARQNMRFYGSQVSSKTKTIHRNALRKKAPARKRHVGVGSKKHAD